MNESRLFAPIKIGPIQLQHRIGLAPMSRHRSSDEHVPSAIEKEYYMQRAAVPGTLLFIGATGASARFVGAQNIPGIYTLEQISAWKEIVSEIHNKGCYIICQLGAFGRLTDPELVEKERIVIMAPSPVLNEEGKTIVKEMTKEDIRNFIEDHVQAARNAIEAGFDAVELDADNGLLIDQFTQDVTNHRTDEYGGSIENRSRFIYELAKAIGDAIGHNRLGARFSPWSTFNGMRMERPIPQFTDVIQKLGSLKLGWIHLIESRIAGDTLVDGSEKLDFAYDNWEGPILVAGGYNSELARKLVDEQHPDRDILVTFGRPFIANPDLVFRIKHGIDLNKYDRSTFYSRKEPKGYIDYPFSGEYLKTLKS